jgi:hypothetical protein
MSGHGILWVIVIPVIVGMIVNQLDALGAWIAVPVVRWAAGLRYAGNPELAGERAEDWAAQIRKSIPGSLGQLGFALGLACIAIVVRTRAALTRNARLDADRLTANLLPLGHHRHRILYERLRRGDAPWISSAEPPDSYKARQHTGWH